MQQIFGYVINDYYIMGLFLYKNLISNFLMWEQLKSLYDEKLSHISVWSPSSETLIEF